MRKSEFLFFAGIVLLAGGVIAIAVSSGSDEEAIARSLSAGGNVNMVSGQELPNGDPYLQRQNEPSLAVSTRNPRHLLAGANDYRTVNMNDESQSIQLPNEDQNAAQGDAWLGLYTSFNGGQSWRSGLHPGYPQDSQTSPLFGYQAAADPVVRAGANGMFYYAGIAFNRPGTGLPPGQVRGCVFVSRLIDDNNRENGNTIRFLDTKVLFEGSPGRFIDKPCLAVGLPYDYADEHKVPIDGGQKIPPHNVYLAFSVFGGQGTEKSQIWLLSSKRCGNEGAQHWNQIKLSEGRSLNQGVALAVDPNDGNIVYVAWRRFSGDGDSNAILVHRSTDGGESFPGDPVVISKLYPFDQGSTPTSFRTNSYPSLTVDDEGVVYAAWSGRKRPFLGVFKRRGLVRISTFDPSSTAGNGEMTWSNPIPIDEEGEGHQFMPSLAFGAGRIVALWYDQRNDKSGQFGRYIDGSNHTIDVRASEALPGAAPAFMPSIQVSRYLFYLEPYASVPKKHQLQFNHPNYPLFKKGTQPFIGDYIDLSPSPMFLPDGDGKWTFHSDPSGAPLFCAAWTDNRDVQVPANGDWKDYTPPASTQPPGYDPQGPAQAGQTRIRDQNVYFANLTGGVIAESPGNSKPLKQDFWRTFVIYVKNTTGETRSFRLTIEVPGPPPPVIRASFLQSETDLKTLDVVIPAGSGVARTVFVKGPDGDKSMFRVMVDEIDEPNGILIPQGLSNAVLLNPDIENPDIENPDIENPDPSNPDIENAEVHNPDIENPDIENPDIENPEVLNPDIENPDIENPEIINPDIENPDIENPDIENRDITNPDIENPDIENSPFFISGSVRDKTWVLRNRRNTTSSYTLKIIRSSLFGQEDPEISYQLLIYRVHTSPVVVDDTLKMKHHDELLACINDPTIFNPDIENPDIENPDIENPDIENPDIENATFFMAPGDEVMVSLRAYKKSAGYWLDLDLEDIDVVATAHAINTGDENSSHPAPPVGSNYDNPRITNKKRTLPQGNVGVPYGQAIVAIGGETPYTWSWTGNKPPGLDLDRFTGLISGTPTQAQSPPYFFTVSVKDKRGNANSKMFQIKINPNL